MIKSLSLVMYGSILALGTGPTVGGLGVDQAPSGAVVTPRGSSDDRPQIVVTTNILGDMVSETVGQLADIEVIMPLGSDPHDFAPSARQAEAMSNADLLVTNGAGFEDGMLDVIANIEDSGTPVFTFADHVDLLGIDGADEEGEDPHIWTDPSRMVVAVEALGEELAGLDGIDGDQLARQVDDYVTQLTALDRDMEATLAVIPDDQRVLITNHEVFGYFADRFDFELVGAVVPSLTTNAEASASQIEGLADLITTRGIPAIFAETTQSTQLADAIAESVGQDVQVVELYTESLGEPGSDAATYIQMMSTDADLIAGALS
ncbi:zinc ABC transporter substrate-binding protein AztC [soil metagenome]